MLFCMLISLYSLQDRRSNFIQIGRVEIRTEFQQSAVKMPLFIALMLRFIAQCLVSSVFYP